MLTFMHKHGFALGLGLLIAVTAIVYSPVRNYHFLNYDDNEYITENYALQKGLTVDSFKWSLTAFHSANWHPATWVSHLLDITWFGYDAGKHHLVNVMFHLLNTVLLAAILFFYTRGKWPALFVAVLFALHPLHVESVAWISERKDLLSTLFMMLALLVYYLYVTVKSNKWLRYLLMSVLFSLGLMSKQMLVSLPLVLLLFDIWPLHRITRNTYIRLILEKVPLIAFSVAAAFMTISAQGSLGALRTTGSLPFMFRLQNALLSYVQYLYKLFWPVHLVVFYPFMKNGILLKSVFALVVLLITTYFALKSFKKYPYLLIGWLFYLLTLGPVIGIIQVGDQAMADRYTYIPLIGIFIIIAFFLEDLLARRFSQKLTNQIWVCLFLLMMSGLAVLSSLQIRHWKDSIALFEHQAKSSPPTPSVFTNLALAYKEKGNNEQAKKYYEMALKINNKYFSALNNLGLLLSEEGDIDGSVYYYQKAIEAEPDNPSLYKIYNNLGIAASNKGNMKSAMEYYQKALDLEPGYDNTYNNMGVASVAQGKYEEAVLSYRQGLKINPRHPVLWNNLGIVYSKMYDLAGAEASFRNALGIDPGYSAARDNLNLILQYKASQRQP